MKICLHTYAYKPNAMKQCTMSKAGREGGNHFTPMPDTLAVKARAPSLNRLFPF